MEQPKQAHVIIVGNEKGGCGKTTTATHICIALLKMGFSVGTIDIDSRQRTFSRYLENRRNSAQKVGVRLALPHHIIVNRSPFNIQEEAEADETRRFTEAMELLKEKNSIVIVDCPGADIYLSQLAHSYADTVVTPVNDSFFDIDVLAKIDSDTFEVIKPSIYSEMLWEQKLKKAKRSGGTIDWLVVRNRLSMLDAKNKRKVADVLERISRRIGCRVAPGFCERVIFRELFLQGLTVMDVMDEKMGVPVSMSHIAARQEVRDLLKVLDIPRVNERIQSLEEQTARKAQYAKEQAEQQPLGAMQPPRPTMPQSAVTGATKQEERIPPAAAVAVPV